MKANRIIVTAVFTGLVTVANGWAQQTSSLVSKAAAQARDSSARTRSGIEPQEFTSMSEAPLTLTLHDALERARANSSQFLSAVADAKIAHEDRVQARAAFLPTVNYATQYLYTQGNGTPSGRYIANNAVHEYISQGNVHEVLPASALQLSDYRRAAAAEAVAQAKAEMAARGLVVTVVKAYYGLIVAERKYATAQQGREQTQRFLTTTQNLERGGEVAHSDVIKAQLQFNQAQRDFQEAQLAMEKARLDLAVLLFPDFTQNYNIVDDLHLAPVLPSFEEVQGMAQRQNPDIRAAMASVRRASLEVSIARSAYFPSLTLDYWYGIDASHFATRTDGIPNLGYSAQGTLLVPIWNWGATRSKVRQADLRRQQARAELSLAQRQLLSNLREFFREAELARSQVDTLHNSADLAAESQRLTTLRYQAGEATVLEVVDAQNTLNLARNNYDNGLARYRLALASLQTLTGNF